MAKVVSKARDVANEQSPVAPQLALPPLDLTNASRLLYHKRLFDLITNVEGDIVECGVGIGTTLLMWASLILDEGGSRRLWGFDSFQGFPEPAPEDESPRQWKKGEWAYATAKDIQDLLIAARCSAEWVRAKVTLVPGYLEETLPGYTGDRIALLHLDVDLYESYAVCLKTLYQSVMPRGIICFDEYRGTFEALSAPGASQAIDEFLRDQGLSIQRDPSFGKYYVVKPA
ncbi:MAG: TylF/MycF family methyltransferase [Actinobacteria bacterium]|nr:TylF/MycF family methyltransferase [Actinomycetota bacterium]